MRTAIKTGVCAVLLAAAGLTAGLDRAPAHAVTTSIVVAVANSTGQCLSPPTAVPTVVGMSNGLPVKLCVWAKDVTDPQGLGSFEIGFTYNGSVVSVKALTPSTTWLNSTGRSVFCSNSVISSNPPNGPYSAAVACSTINQPPPYGPQGMGLLGTVIVSPGSQPGFTTLAFPVDTLLYDTGYVQGTVVYSPERINATVNSLNYRVAQCADYNNDNTVRMPDIYHIVQKYGTHDVPTDLDLSGTVLTPDINVGVMEYGHDCPPPP